MSRSGAPAKPVSGLDYLDILGLQAFLTLGHSKFDFLSLGQGLEAFSIYGAEMHKNIGPGFLFDETKTFRIIEELYCSGNRV